jgi:hypothetical protein
MKEERKSERYSRTLREINERNTRKEDGRVKK